MTMLFKNVKAKRIRKNPNSIDFQIELPDTSVIYLYNCQIINDITTINTAFISLQGNIEVNNGKECHYKEGIIHLMTENLLSFSFQFVDLLKQD